MRTLILALLASASFACSAAADDKAGRTELFKPGLPQARESAAAPSHDPAWYEGFGAFGLDSGARSDKARRHFEQGLGLLWGFNHAAAATAFRAAQAADPDCSLCYWGEAYALGPNLNDDVHAENEAAARAAAARALDHAGTPREKAMAEALMRRYDETLPDQSARNAAFAEAIGAVAARFPGDANLLVFKADALMNLQPWDYWEADAATPKGRGADILAALEDALRLAPKHPAALHLYIHAVEASADPARAEKAADALRGLVPAAGHLVHMPAHIYNRLGRYADSIAVNSDAVAADERFLALAGETASPLYRFGYYPHNVHFLLVGAQNAGLKEVALEAADKLAAITSDEVSAELAWVQAIRTAPYAAHAQFSDADTVMALPDPGGRLPLVQGFWRYARASALVAAGRVSEAQAELDALKAHLARSDFAALEAQFLPAREVLGIAAETVAARLASARGDAEAALAHIAAAERHEAAVPYMEPPYWPSPVARTKGAVLLAAGRPEAAAEAFEAALKRAPRDGWALWGLREAQAAAVGAAPDAAQAASIAERTKAFEKAWLGDPATLSLERL